MLCDICGKNPATVHLTEIVNEEMTELHLCEACAQAKSQQMEQQFGLSDLLAGMADFDKPVSKEEIVSSQCPNCKLAYTDFKKIGRLGCGECYTAFRKYLGPLLKRIHGSGQHVGKVPIKLAKTIARKRTSIDELRLKLQKAIETEAFEEAARIRDQIKELEKKPPEENAAE